MLELIDEALESFLRAEVPLSSTDIDVSFDPPDRAWSARLSRPTINLFLWDLRRSASRSRSGMQTVERNGVMVHQPALPVVELRYVVTAWASDHGDERGLLSGVLRVMLKHGSLPRAYLSDTLAELELPSLLVARSGEDQPDITKALDGQIKPGINVSLSTEFDTGLVFPAGRPTTSVETGVGLVDGTASNDASSSREVRRRIAGEVVGAADRGAIGAIVRSSIDITRVNAAGRFLLRAEPGDEITLETSPPVVATVPTIGGLRFE